MAPSVRRILRPLNHPRPLARAGLLAGGLSLVLAVAADPVVARDDGPAARAAAPSSATRSGPAADADTDAGARRTARSFVDETGLLGSAPGEGLETASTTGGVDGVRYVAYERTFRGLPVIGGDAVVAVADSGKVIGATTAHEGPVAVSSLTPAVSTDVARAQARDRLDRVRSTGEPRLVVHALGAAPRLAWQTRVRGVLRGLPSDQVVWTDARTGGPIGADDLVAQGAGRGYYNGRVSIATSVNRRAEPRKRWAMVDPRRPGVACGAMAGGAYRGPDDTWGNARGASLETACVDVLYAVAQQWAMLSRWLGRDGVLGDGSGVPARVGWQRADAMFTGRYTAYGYSRDKARTLTSLDVVGHENGHAVFESTPGGSLSGEETGALSEGAGDILGTLTEAYADNPRDDPDYLIGEQASPYGTGALRNLADPAAVGDPACYTSAIPDTEVHAGAGPLDHWFYLLAEGSAASSTCNGGTVQGIGIREAGQVFYQGLLLKTSAWAYTDARRATLIAAKAIGHGGCATFQQVRAAWDAAAVPARADEPTCPGAGSAEMCSEVTRTGSVSQGENSYQPWTKGFPVNAGRITGCLTGTGGDPELYLQRWDGAMWRDVAGSDATGPQEQVSRSVTAGYYRWAVFGFQGGADFTLSYDVP